MCVRVWLWLCVLASPPPAAVVSSKGVDPAVRARTIEVSWLVRRGGGVHTITATCWWQMESKQFSGIVAQHAHNRTIARDNEIFDQHLRQFMTRLRDRASQQFNSHLANLCTRLDYNDFYGSHLNL